MQVICSARGFALIVTVVLLAFLVLLITALATLTRVETQVAANQLSQARARQVALMALHLAVGQLQAHAGPDARVTATGDILANVPLAAAHITGVWGAEGSGADPIAWLVSGSEKAGATPAGVLAGVIDPVADETGADTVWLVGDGSVSDRAQRVRLVKQDLRAPPGELPGVGAGATPRLGRYAWWIGDQGVKASLALPDRADEVTYAPWNTPVQRARIRQQIGSGPNYFRAGNAESALSHVAREGFDPLANPGLSRIAAPGQLALLTPAAGSLTGFVRDHYHDFTTAAHAVLANTLPSADPGRGLLRDLSLKPGELGPAFAAYADYESHQEAPGSTLAWADPAYPEIKDADSPRRRHRLVPAAAVPAAPGLPGLAFGVSPVIADFMLQFRFFYQTANQVTARVRLYVSLWNPYTAALAPTAADDLGLEISGLPVVTITNTETGATNTLDLQAALPAVIRGPAGELAVKLPFGDGGLTTNGTRADRSSWLPGRVYGWTTNAGGAPSEALRFYSKTLKTTGWSYAPVALPGSNPRDLAISTRGAQVPGLTLRLRTASGVLATVNTPAFLPVDVAPGSFPWKFAFAARLRQPLHASPDRTWLKIFDPRDPALSSGAWRAFDVNDSATPPFDPNLYASGAGAPTTYTETLLYRIQGTSSSEVSQSSYNDVPLFELPRLPLLSLGELQHMQVPGVRPFAIGNSWGGPANAIFDRFFFSGLAPATNATRGEPALSAGQPLPNWNLRVLDGADAAGLRSAGALSSRHLLQAGGFNLNSTRAAAWRAVLSGVRFPRAFGPADIENAGGEAFGTQKNPTAVGQESFAADTSLGAGTPAPAFLRFAQSAQETFFWKPVADGYGDKRQTSTYAFRLGVRGAGDPAAPLSTVDASVNAHGLSTDQVETLAGEIVRRIKARAAVSGPFRNLREFLGPASGAGSPSVLEQAIEGAGLNAPEVRPLDQAAALPGGGHGMGLSSLTLTQADLMTALAPYLRPRSDTFIVRAYGEARNPATDEAEGAAWLEATLQRFPETVDSADNVEKPAGVFGRRFKIISFRWLAPSEV